MLVSCGGCHKRSDVVLPYGRMGQSNEIMLPSQKDPAPSPVRRQEEKILELWTQGLDHNRQQDQTHLSFKKASLGLLPLGIHYVYPHGAWIRRVGVPSMPHRRRCGPSVSKHGDGRATPLLARRGHGRTMGVVRCKHGAACLLCEERAWEAPAALVTVDVGEAESHSSVS